MSNDFFNLNSDDDEEEEEKDTKRNEAAIRKWDWDREENVKLFYGQNKTEKASYPGKKLKVEPGPSSRLESDQSESVSNKGPYIERVEAESGASSTRLLFNLNGHSATVNRIHWRKGNNSILLSSSMDRYLVV